MKFVIDLSCIWLYILFIIKSVYLNNVRIEYVMGYYIFMFVNWLLI